MTAFLATLDTAPRGNGKPVTASDARAYLTRCTEAFRRLCESEAWTHASREEVQGAIDAMQDVRARWRMAERAERRARRVEAEFADE